MRFADYLIALTAIMRFSSAIDLQCSTIDEVNWSFVGRISICNVANVQITKRGGVMTSANTVANYNQLKGIVVDRQTMNYLPKFTDELGKRIEVILVQHCHLKAIERDDLSPFPLLKELNLRYNDLTSLPRDLLLSSPRLKFLNFEFNPLISVSANFLKPLSNLEHVDFRSAGCIDILADTPAEVENIKLELLVKCESADSRLVDQLEQGKLKMTSEVTRLQQTINELKLKALEDQRQLTAAEKRFQQQLRSCDRNLNSATQILSPLLAQVVLSSDHQSNVELICSRYSNETKTCNVVDLSIENSGTKVVSVKDELGSEVHPTSLIIRHQAALFLPINLHEAFPDLQHLEVSSSGLFHVNIRTFSKLDKLASLNLMSNKISNIVSGSFADLKPLQSLDLSSNRIEAIEAGGLAGLQSIKALKLNDNQLKQIAANFLASMTSLESVDLHDNSCINLAYPGTSLKDIEAVIVESCVAPLKLNCITSNDHHVCDAENLQVEHAKAKILTVNGKSPENVTILAVEGQLVKFLPAQLLLTFPRLQKLVVSRSQLTVLSKDDFAGLTDLRWVEICDNQISSIEAGTFDVVAQLVHLDLSSNHIRSLPTKIFERLTKLIELRLSINELKVLNSDIFPVPNVIKEFRGDNNKLEVIDMKVLVLLRNADEIDLEGNTCIDDKYEKDDESSKKQFAGFFGLVGMDCVVA